ncbi:Uncharacterized protein PBTT_08213 [Plasmodiophora brassicae]
MDLDGHARGLANALLDRVMGQPKALRAMQDVAPVLLEGLIKMLEQRERSGGESADPLQFLASYLMRNNPRNAHHAQSTRKASSSRTPTIQVYKDALQGK